MPEDGTARTRSARSAAKPHGASSHANHVSRPARRGAATLQPPSRQASSGAQPTREVRHHPTGVKRLDHLLEGGIPFHQAALLYGPAFIGKELLARLSLAHSLAAGQHAIFVHTKREANHMQDALARLEPALLEHCEAGRLHLVDTYSRPVGAPEDTPWAHYVDGPLDLNGLTIAINEAQKAIDGAPHLLVIDSVSTLLAHSSPAAAFRFLQVLLGRARRGGAATLALMDHGMHADGDVQMFRHIMDGAIDVRDHNGKNQIQVLGLGIPQNLGWVDYRYQGDRFEVTGSFAAGRIR